MSNGKWKEQRDAIETITHEDFMAELDRTRPPFKERLSQGERSSSCVDISNLVRLLIKKGVIKGSGGV